DLEVERIPAVRPRLEDEALVVERDAGRLPRAVGLVGPFDERSDGDDPQRVVKADQVRVEADQRRQAEETVGDLRGRRGRSRPGHALRRDERDELAQPAESDRADAGHGEELPLENVRLALLSVPDLLPQAELEALLEIDGAIHGAATS